MNPLEKEMPFSSHPFRTTRGAAASFAGGVFTDGIGVFALAAVRIDGLPVDPGRIAIPTRPGDSRAALLARAVEVVHAWIDARY